MEDEVFQNLSEKVREEFEGIGLYLNGPMQVQGVPMNEEIGEAVSSGAMTQKDALKGGLADFMLLADFSIGQVAWSQRVLDPKGFAEAQEFANMVPDTDEDVKVAEINAILEADSDGEE